MARPTNAEIAARETRSDNREPEGRKTRVPVGVQRMKMSAPERKGYIRRWVNDEMDGRVKRFEEGGYQFVEDATLQIGDKNLGNENRNLGSRVSRVVGTHPNGEPKLAYLMEIKKEFYDEDQKAKEKINREIDDAIRAGSLANNIAPEDRYTPKEGRKFETI